MEDVVTFIGSEPAETQRSVFHFGLFEGSCIGLGDRCAEMHEHYRILTNLICVEHWLCHQSATARALFRIISDVYLVQRQSLMPFVCVLQIHSGVGHGARRVQSAGLLH